MKIRSSALSHVGRKRDRNEDGFLERADRGLFLVADGVGGCRSGEVASATAVRVFAEAGPPEPRDPESWLRNTLTSASEAVARLAAERAELDGMATTCTVLLLGEDAFHVLHVGDSRAYLLRGGKLSQVTSDHTVTQVLVDLGDLTAEEASRHPMRNQLTRVLGQTDLQPEYHGGKVEPGDLWLLCSDGLSSVVPEADWRALLSRTELTLGERAALLIDAANARGGLDNITVVVIEVLAAPAIRDGEDVSLPVTASASVRRPVRGAARGNWLRRWLPSRRGGRGT